MSDAIRPASLSHARLPRAAAPRLPARLLAAAALLGGGVAGVLATPGTLAHAAVAQAGPELTRLLRTMAVLKLALVGGAAAFVWWRLRFPARPVLAASYAAALAMAAAAPGLIWGMAHVVPGAVLMHGGLVLLAVLFWRDEGSPAILRLPARR